MAPAPAKGDRAARALALGTLLVACAAVGTAAAAEQSIAKGLQDFMTSAQQPPKEGGKDLRQYYISAKKDMGVTHCALQGVLRNNSAPRDGDSEARCATFEPFEYKGELVTVHLFMKMIVRDAIAYVRGYAVVEMVGHHNLAWHFLGNAAAANDLWSHEISLGSSRTNTIYGPIKVFNATGEFSKYFELAPIHLKPEDAINPELEVYSEHLGYACYLLPAKESSLKNILGKVQRPSRTVEVDDEPAERNSLFMLAPFFNIPVEVVARLLHWSIRWHEQFSVDAYVLYVQRDLHVFLELPEVQMLIERGRLVVVHWDVLPTLVTPTFLGPEPKTTCLQYIGYWHKLIIYNHFFAAMWMENVHVFMADYDEWLVTKKPMTISQIMEECTGGGDTGVMASVELRRRISSCESCGETLERDLWTGRDPAGPLDQHPVLEYSVGPIDNKPKTLYNPEYIMAVGAHAGTPVNGSTAFSVPDTTCAFVLHMFKMMVDRHYPRDKAFAAHPMKLTQDELWPLRSATSESKALRRVSRQLKLW